jgi:cytochrome bd-type quinol oxidase subunit 1
MSDAEKPRSRAWFLLPIFFGVIGGIIAFFILRKDDLPKAKNCLYLGLVFMVIGILFNLVVGTSLPGIDSSFDVNI